MTKFEPAPSLKWDNASSEEILNDVIEWKKRVEQETFTLEFPVPLAIRLLEEGIV